MISFWITIYKVQDNWPLSSVLPLWPSSSRFVHIQNLLDLEGLAVPLWVTTKYKCTRSYESWLIIHDGEEGTSGARCTEGVPQCSGPLLEVIVVIVCREQGRQEPKALRLWYATFHNPHLTFPVYCVTQRGESRLVSSGLRMGREMAPSHIMDIQGFLIGKRLKILQNYILTVKNLKRKKKTSKIHASKKTPKSYFKWI